MGSKEKGSEVNAGTHEPKDYGTLGFRGLGLLLQPGSADLLKDNVGFGSSLRDSAYLRAAAGHGTSQEAHPKPSLWNLLQIKTVHVIF